MKYIDCHAHINFAAYDADRDGVIARMKEAGVIGVNVGTKLSTSESAVALAEAHEHLYAIVGLHPVHTSACHHDEAELGPGASPFTSKGEEFDMEKMRAFAKHKKVVAIGECGLDYYHLTKENFEKNPSNNSTSFVTGPSVLPQRTTSTSQSSALPCLGSRNYLMDSRIENQEKIFRQHIELALEVGKPLMVHCRNAYMDAVKILKEYPGIRGNFHFFAGTLDELRAILDLGFYVSYTGVITFAKQYEELVRATPLDRILSETDCPYVTPVPHRGKRNEPIHVREVVKKMAELRGEDEETLRAQILKNAETFFSIKI